MSVNVTDFMTKIQEEGLDAIKQSQEASLKAMQSFNRFAKEWSDKPGTIPAFEHVPSPTQFVEMSFGFASQLLEIRKSYTMKVAEMMVDVQKQVENRVENRTESNFNQAPVSKPVNK